MSTEETLFNPDDPRLTAYALGELTDAADRAEIEQLLADSPGARAELADIRALTAALTEEYEQERASAAATPAKVVPMPSSRRPAFAPWLQIAALLLLVGLAAGMWLPIYRHAPARSQPASVAIARVAVPPMAPRPEVANSARTVLPVPAAPVSVAASHDPLPAAENRSPAAPIPPQTPSASAGPDRPMESNDDAALLAAAPPAALTAARAAPPTSTTRQSALQPKASVTDTRRLAQSAGAWPAAAKSDDGFGADKKLAAADSLPSSEGRSSLATDVPAGGGAASEIAGQAALSAPEKDADSRHPTMNTRADEEFNTADYAHTVENRFLTAQENPLSTFSIDVDTASYSIVRRFIDAGRLPPKDAVRVEEMLNYFPYEDAPPAPGSGQPFAIHLEAAACPWNIDHRLVRIGIKARELDRAERPPSNLVFLLDVSGSMMPPERLPLIKKCLRLLVEQLREDDHVAIVVYAGASGLALPSTAGDHKDAILRAIDNLRAGGSTNGAAGIRLAYQVARKNFIQGGTNRVILSTDGDFNVGTTSRGDLLRLVEKERRDGVFLTVLGVGTDNLKDSTMQLLADHGNGNYAYVDRLEEGRKVLVDQMSGTLVTVAKDVKIQVEFNPATVASYRLIGYEKRLLHKEDFNDDRVDAGEIGAGHGVTALYEVVPAGRFSPSTGPAVDALKYQPAPAVDAAKRAPESASHEWLTVKVRQKTPDGDRSERTEEAVLADRDAPGEFANASPDFQFAAAVASFGLVLRDSPFRGNATLGSALELAQAGKGEDPNGYRAGFVELLRHAQALRQEDR